MRVKELKMGEVVMKCQGKHIHSTSHRFRINSFYKPIFLQSQEFSHCIFIFYQCSTAMYENNLGKFLAVFSATENIQTNNLSLASCSGDPRTKYTQRLAVTFYKQPEVPSQILKWDASPPPRWKAQSSLKKGVHMQYIQSALWKTNFGSCTYCILSN